MKLAPLIFLFIALELSLVIFYQPDITEAPGYLPNSGNYTHTANLSYYNTNNAFTLPQNTSIPGVVVPNNIDSSYIWSGWSDFRLGSSTPLIIAMIAFAVFLWASAFFFNRNDTANFAPMFILFLGLGLIPVCHLAILIDSEVSAYACTAGQVCWLSGIISLIIPGILYIFWFLACYEAWSKWPIS